MRGDITDMGILHRDDVGVRILLQFDAQFSAFGVESKNTISFTFFFGLDRERLIATLPNWMILIGIVVASSAVRLLRPSATFQSMQGR